MSAPFSGSRSFRLAARLLPRDAREDAAAAYAWCRRVDDLIDESPAAERAPALARLRAELDEIYAGGRAGDPFAEVVRRRAIPRAYPEALLDGMAMDVAGGRYQTVDELLLYCHRVAGVVGLLMCHIMGLSDAAALRRAAHLGIAMQLTNICRDVEEDGRNGRVYLPADLLPAGERWTVMRLLLEADRYYASADRGMAALPWRCGLAVRAARNIYAAIGRVLERRRYDVWAGRAVVSGGRKLLLVLAALGQSLLRPALRPFRPAALPTLRYPDDVLPL